MKSFFDTSVLVASFWGGHTHHASSVKLLASATLKTSACSAHTLAELFASMTALPVRPAIPPEQALLFIDEVRERLRLIALDSEDYVTTVQEAAGRGFSGGRIYDALLLRCARKCNAEAIYTWNLKHFLALAPDLASRIRTP